ARPESRRRSSCRPRLMGTSSRPSRKSSRLSPDPPDLLSSGMTQVTNPLTRKLSQLAPLSSADRKVIDALQSPLRAVARNRELIRSGQRYDGLLILIEGIAIRSRVFHDGRRQILNIAIP